ncbi:homocitrate synthase/isopropylmalate synthase family protein [Sporomusa termitida]|uniref:2-isopropylmalate synthase n=1 Tax=Sporomusa termitida TaxID=2377 RepID=A0A517DR64_9FIRM|nr:hypothetical protein [Sporomusa termitida]QDR79862.1 2-isopropylmalate synthase [Sporomusa termitida]
MKTDVIFIDQTLGYGLEHQGLGTSEFIYIQRKIAALAQVMFDVSLQSLVAVLDCGAVAVKDIRAGIAPDARQVALAHQSGCSKVKVNLNAMDFCNLAAPVAEALRQARARGLAVSLQLTGNCQYSSARLLQLCWLISKYEISSVAFVDEYSDHDPLFTYGALLNLQQQLPCPIEYCGKNGSGLATANALGAIKSGVACVAVAVGGVAGYPAFEEVLMGARFLLKLPLAVPANIATCCEEILSYIGQCVQPTKPIIGSDIFAHESGIHVDGVNKKSDLYEFFTPETVGLSRKIVIGKHSGKAAIELKLKELNIFLQPTAVLTVLEKVRSLAIRQKAPVSDLQLQKLVHEVAS